MITVLGAGVAGLCMAHEFAARGLPVRIADPGGGPGRRGCSWWAGGMLAPFCEGEAAEEPVIRLGQASADWWQAAGATVIRNGTLVLALARDRTELDRFARRTRQHRTLDRDGIAALEPGLAARFDRALFFPTEAHLTPRDALSGMWDGLVAKGIPVDAAPEGRFIDCRGLAARDRLPDLRGVRGETVMLRAPGVSLHRPVRLLHPRHPLYIIPRGQGVFMLGATQIETDGRGPATLRSVTELLGAAYALDPAFAEAEIIEIGADARPAFPDNLPRIRRHGDRILANGLFRHGFLLAPVLARMVADLVERNIEPEFMDEDHGEW